MPFSTTQKGRSVKPRKNGLTMVIDWGAGLHAVADLVETAAEHTDYAKLAVGTAAVTPREVLRRKLEVYATATITPFVGGQFLEFAGARDKVEGLLAYVGDVGITCIEVSDNLIARAPSWKHDLIGRIRDRYEFEVLAEVGRKDAGNRSMSLADDAAACVAAGAELVLVEAAELFDRANVMSSEARAVVDSIGLNKTMFELPGPWIPGTTSERVHTLRSKLVCEFGTNVNVGNVGFDDVVSLEAYRRGLGVNAGMSPSS